jgi:hypothetical protein
MLRKIALSLLMLISIVTILPFADSTAHSLRHGIARHRHRHHRHHSRRWWRRHRALMRRRRAAALAHRKASLTTSLPQPASVASNASGPAKTAVLQLPSQSTLSVVALSRPAPAFLTMKEQSQILGGVSFSEMRRIVIDKMINAGGWVTNDYQRDVSGRRVFIVTAHTPADGRSPEKNWNFYFTEVNGRIYSLTTEATMESSERVAAEAERFIASLH